MSESLFAVGDRVAYSNGEGHDPRWFFGAIQSVAGDRYRISWDDGLDDPTTYTAGSLLPESEVPGRV